MCACVHVRMCACVFVCTYLCSGIGVVKRALLVHVFDRNVCAKVEEEFHYVAKPCLACLTCIVKTMYYKIYCIETLRHLIISRHVKRNLIQEFSKVSNLVYRLSSYCIGKKKFEKCLPLGP